MNNESPNPVVAQGAAQFNEQLKHDEIMEKLKGVCGYQYVDYGCNEGGYHDGPYVCWHDGSLSLEDLTEIMNRGRHDEIMYMIYRYNNAVDYENQQKTSHLSYFSFPEEIQVMLAKRNNAEELNEYFKVQGFGALGQDVILERGNHDEILNYVRRHGLLANQQRKLLEHNVRSEIVEHVTRHGLCDELLDDMFKEVQEGKMSWFQDFVSMHELPVKYQKIMLNIVNSETFSQYIEHYGLWEDAHETLIKMRSDDDIKLYIARHRYLSYEAEKALAAKRNTDLNTAYIKSKHNIASDTRFLICLLMQRPLDYASITRILLVVKPKRYCADCYVSDTYIMKHGTRDQVRERIAKKERLTLENLGILFFRNDPELFEAYLDSCSYDNYFWN